MDFNAVCAHCAVFQLPFQPQVYVARLHADPVELVDRAGFDGDIQRTVQLINIIISTFIFGIGVDYAYLS